MLLESCIDVGISNIPVNHSHLVIVLLLHVNSKFKTNSVQLLILNQVLICYHMKKQK